MKVVIVFNLIYISLCKQSDPGVIQKVVQKRNLTTHSQAKTTSKINN